MLRVSDQQPQWGPIRTAIEQDLHDLGELRGGARRTFAAMARQMADVLDARGNDEGVTATARLAEVLRSTLTALTEGTHHDPNATRDFIAMMSTPQRSGGAPANGATVTGLGPAASGGAAPVTRGDGAATGG